MHGLQSNLPLMHQQEKVMTISTAGRHAQTALWTTTLQQRTQEPCSAESNLTGSRKHDRHEPDPVQQQEQAPTGWALQHEQHGRQDREDDEQCVHDAQQGGNVPVLNLCIPQQPPCVIGQTQQSSPNLLSMYHQLSRGPCVDYIFINSLRTP